MAGAETLSILFLAVTSPLTADGEGTARIVSPERLVAGSRTRVTIEVSVGPTGVPVGGGVALGLHHAATWPGLQASAPERPGYMTVSSGTPDNLHVAWHGWAPKGTFRNTKPSRRSDGIFHQCLIARVTRKPLQPGQRVTFVIGANDHKATVPKSTDRNHEFHISTDVDGDGTYQGIGESPRMDIVPAPAHHLAGSAPASLVVGKPFDFQIRAEDEFYNLATDYSGTVTVRDEDGSVLARDAPVKHGLARIRLVVRNEGPRRFRLSARQSSPGQHALGGRSNPCRAFVKAPERRIFWGDIHGHTSISDGLGDSADEYFSFGRDVADLDVCALTDHGHFAWPENIQAVKTYYEPGRYVTILGQEAGARSDHMDLYFRHDDTPHINGWATRYDQFFRMVYEQYNKDRPEVIVGPHHFTYDRGDDRYPFGLFDTRTARFVEVYSSHGTSEYLGNPRPCRGARDKAKFMQSGLAKGLRFGVIASSDNHDSHPGRSIWGHYPGGLVAFLARELTREAIWQALWNYHVYATSFDRIYVEFTINGKPMGSDVVTSGPCRITYYVIGKTDNVKVFLIRNNQEHRVDQTTCGVIEAAFEDVPPQGSKSFYYLRVVQDNGERAWSTPIWVTRR